jgi:cytochrome b561
MPAALSESRYSRVAIALHWMKAIVALTPILQHGFERNQGVPRARNSHH